MALNLKHIILSLFVFSSISGFAADTLKLDSSLQVQVLAMDSKRNIFLADQNNSIVKLDKSAKEVTRVNTKLYGDVYSIDCSNPFELYVFYRDQNKIVFYDNMLNVRGEFDLTVFGYGTIRAACRSFDNGIWLYDLSSLELKKVMKDGVLSQNSGPLSNFIDGDFNPHSIVERNHQVYLADSSVGILVFDMFGTFIKKIPMLGISSFDIDNELLIALVNGEIISYHLKEFKYQKFPASAHKISAFAYASTQIIFPQYGELIRLTSL